MPFQVNHRDALEYLTSDSLPGTVHCFSTRHGGVSTGYLSSLNLGTHRGDTPENVLKNYEILGNALGFTPEQTVFSKQIHTDVVAPVTRENCGEGLFRPVTEGRDGIMTNEPGVTLVVFSADCTLILLHDPVKKAIAAVHSGWRGTALGIVQKAVEAMTAQYGSNPKDIHAAIGPCISRCCFETSADVPTAMRDALGQAAEEAIVTKGEKFLVDLKVLNRIWLTKAGVTSIDISADCTCCQPERFWTHRLVGNERGSLAAVIMLPREDTP